MELLTPPGFFSTTPLLKALRTVDSDSRNCLIFRSALLVKIGEYPDIKEIIWLLANVTFYQNNYLDPQAPAELP